MYFEILGDIKDVEVIATGPSIRRLPELQARYGPGRWRKLKGVARARMEDGRNFRAGVHWYEAHGIDVRISRSSADWTEFHEH